METVNLENPVRIVIVDDHPNTASMLARVLTRFDSPVEIFTAAKAEDVFQQIGEKGMDILITDFMMPGMNGLELIERLKGNQKPAYVILITAYDTPGLAISARRLNVKNYLVKPVQPDKIREIVKKAIDELRPSEKRQTNLRRDRKFKILVADDHPDNLRLLSARLENEGYIFIPAWDGEEALTKIREESPDLVLLDVNMPKKDGFQVLEEMRAHPASELIPVIVITAARIGPKDVRDGFSLGADDYVIKPFDWRELAARIQSKLRVKQAEDDLRRKYREFEIFLQLGEVLRDQQTVDGIVENVVNLLVDQFGVSSASLEILDVIALGMPASRRAFHNEVAPPDVIARREAIPPDGGVVISYGCHCEVRGNPAAEPLQIRMNATPASAITRQVIKSGKWVFSHLDGTVQDGWENLLWGDVTGVAAPVSRNGRLIGVMSLLNEQAGFFDAENIHLLEAVTNFTALALEKAERRGMDSQARNDIELELANASP